MTSPRLTDEAVARWSEREHTGETIPDLVRALALDLRDCREQRRALLAEVREATRMLKVKQKELDERPVL